MHKRIRQFNTKATYPEQNLHISESVAIGEAAGQIEPAMVNVDMLLKEAGSQLEHLCTITITIYIVETITPTTT